MAEPDYLTTGQGRRIAYRFSPGAGVPVVFLGGFMSDMDGSKALHLEGWARGQGRPFLRFDYSGHGASDGEFNDGAIGDWAEDAAAVLAAVLDAPAVLVGSSMGGWIALWLAREMPGAVAGLVTIAAAPDFTEDSMWAGFDPAQRQALETVGHVVLPSDYDAPYIITRRLIEEGRDRLVLRAPLPLPFAVRMLQGTADTSVTRETALGLLDHAKGPDMRLCFVKGADHSFSTPECLDLIEHAIGEVTPCG